MAESGQTDSRATLLIGMLEEFLGYSVHIKGKRGGKTDKRLRDKKT